MNHCPQSFLRTAIVFLATLLACQGLSAGAPPIEAVTFAADSKKIYVPLADAAKKLRWEVQRDEKKKSIRLRKFEIPAASLRKLLDGTELVSVDILEKAGATIDSESKPGQLTISKGFCRFKVVVGAKRAEVNLATQKLTAWQGKRLVLQTRISSGKGGRTPAGNFRAGPYKSRKHYSSRYNNAPMPWSVQVQGHVFIHGFTSVPNYPASHGCIRVPLTKGNPAKFFYEWVDRGTPIKVIRKSP